MPHPATALQNVTGPSVTCYQLLFRVHRAVRVRWLDARRRTGGVVVDIATGKPPHGPQTTPEAPGSLLASPKCTGIWMDSFCSKSIALVQFNRPYQGRVNVISCPAVPDRPEHHSSFPSTTYQSILASKGIRFRSKPGWL